MQRLMTVGMSLVLATCVQGKISDVELSPALEASDAALLLPSGVSGGDAEMPTPLADSTTASAGETSGSFALSVTGTATYSIPIVVPPGRRGIEPKLSIGYDSSHTFGLMGVGFDLAGASSTITPCGKNLAQDGISAPVYWDLNPLSNTRDNLCLDGQRLRLKAGTLLEDGAEYRTDRDTFVKVIQHGVGATLTSFTVYRKDGRILTYGETPNCTTCNGRMPGRTSTRAWALSEVADRFGNTMHIYYTQRVNAYGDGSEVMEFYPLKITYTGGNGTSESREVYFYYTANHKPVKGYYAGIRTETTQVLYYIRTKVDGQRIRDYSITYSYVVGPGTDRITRIQEIGADGVNKPATDFEWQLGTDTYTKSSTTIATPPATVGPDPAHGNTTATIGIVTGDFNGDGKTDLFYPKGMAINGVNGTWRRLASGASGLVGQAETNLSSVAASWPYLAAKLNLDGDGKDDVLLINNATAYSVVLGDNTSSTLLSSTFNRTNSLTNPDAFSKYFRVADLNGDGLSDLLTCAPDTGGNYKWHYRLNTGSGVATTAWGDNSAEKLMTSGYPTVTLANCGNASGTANTGTAWRAFLFDVDGDGSADLLMDNDSDGNYEAYSFTHSYKANWSTGLPTAFYSYYRQMDVNRDGLMDFVAPYSGAGGAVRYWPNTGAVASGTFLGGANGLGASIANDYGQYAGPLLKSTVTDFDNNRLDDLMLDGSNSTMSGCGASPLPACPTLITNWKVLRNTGSSSFAVVNTGVSYTSTTLPSYSVDDNGDLIPDVLTLEGGYFRVIRHNGSKSDLLVKLREGLVGLTSTPLSGQNSVQITYAPSTNTSVYAGKTATDGVSVPTCGYPQLCENPKRMLVSSHTVDTGTASNRTFNHLYYDWRKDALGGRPLGFHQHQIIDQTTGSFTVSTYDNYTYDSPTYRFPLVGMLRQRTTDLRPVATYGGRQVTVDSYTLSYFTTDATTTSYFPYSSIKLTSLYETGTSTAAPTTNQRVRYENTSVSVNSYGETTNAYYYVDLTGSGTRTQTETVTKVFSDDATNWLIGRPTSVVRRSLVETPNKTRTTTYAYYPTTGAVQTITTDEGLQTTFAYDVYGNVTSKTETAGAETRTTTTTYDSEGVYPYSVTNPLGHVSKRVYDRGRGVLLVAAGPNFGNDGKRLSTRWSYDTFGRQRSELRPDGTQTTTSYAMVGSNPSALEITTAATGDNTVTARYDRLGRATRTSWFGWAGATVAIDSAFNSNGDLASRSAPYFLGTETAAVETYTYDNAHRLVLATRPWGSTVQTTYTKLTTDANFYVATQDELLRWNAKVYDPQGRLAQARFGTTSTGQSPTLGSTSYGYASFDALTSMTDAQGVVTTITRDAYGRTLSNANVNTGTRSYTYDAFGQKRTETDATGQVVNLSYDKLGRLLKGSDGASELIYDTATRGIGQLAQAYNDEWSIDYTYDLYGRLQAITNTNGQGGIAYSETLAYDGSGRVSSRNLNSQNDSYDLTFSYEYDGYGRLKRVYNGALSYWTLGSTDARENVLTETSGNGKVTTYTYHATKHRVASISTPSLQNLQYGYDAKNQLQYRTDLLQSRLQYFAYDGLDRVTSMSTCDPGTTYPCTGTTVRTFAYDVGGNMTSDNWGGTRTFHATRKQLMTKSSFGNYTYDANGNTTAMPGVTTINWRPGEHRIQSMVMATGTTSFTYDPFGRRVIKQRPSGYPTTWFFSDMLERERTGTGPITRRFLVKVGSRIVATSTRVDSGAETVNYVHRDHLGSGDVSSNSSGAVVQYYPYEPFGRAMTSWKTDATVVTPQEPLASAGFTGQDAFTELELVDMRGRVYDPRSARFLSPDPIMQDPADTRSLNRYSYVWNNPLNATDPSGYCASINGHGCPQGPNINVPVTSDGSDDLSYLGHTSINRPSGGYDPTQTGDLARLLSQPGAAHSLALAAAGGGTLLEALANAVDQFANFWSGLVNAIVGPEDVGIIAYEQNAEGANGATKDESKDLLKPLTIAIRALQTFIDGEKKRPEDYIYTGLAAASIAGGNGLPVSQDLPQGAAVKGEHVLSVIFYFGNGSTKREFNFSSTEEAKKFQAYFYGTNPSDSGNNYAPRAGDQINFLVKTKGNKQGVWRTISVTAQ